MIYIIRHGASHFVKIGFAEDVTERVKLLQCGTPEVLVLLRTLPGCRGVEAWMHNRFREFRHRSEWFVFQDEMLTIVPPADFRSTALVVRLCKYEQPLRLAMKAAGGPTAMARALGISPSAVTNWDILPPRWLPHVSALTGMSHEELRPDLYAEAAKLVPTSAPAAARAA